MYPTVFLPVGFGLAVTVLLAIVPLISAAPSDSQPSQREIHFRDDVDPDPSRHRKLPAGWVEQSCFSDNPSARTLTSVALFSQKMTVNTCVNTCDIYNLVLAGLENGTDCYCGNVTTHGSTYTSVRDCKIPCPGNSTQTCGGTTSLSLWANTNIPRQPDPIFTPHVSNWTFAGCFSDSNKDRTLTFQFLDDRVFSKYSNSAELCVSLCENAGWSVAGMEFALECWCGKTIDRRRSRMLDNSNCMLACPGNTREFCGGQNSLAIYSSPPH